MKQHPIDLLPEGMRAQTQARVVASRNIGLSVLAAFLLGGMITHARMGVSRAHAQLETLSASAAEFERNEQKARAMRLEIADYRRLIDRYQRIEMPLPVSRLIATLAEEMPESMTLERLDLHAAGDRGARAIGPARRRGEEEAPPPRLLVAELSGFALDDFDITEFVTRLDGRPPFERVSLDFSRQRVVRGVTAREFRLSFQIDLDAVYDIRTGDDLNLSRSITP